MITHIVIFSWKPGVTQDQVSSFGQALSQMAAELAPMVVIYHGSNLAFRDGNGDYALMATFPNKDGWDAYQAHATHKAFVRDFVTPLAARLAIQF